MGGNREWDELRNERQPISVKHRRRGGAARSGLLGRLIGIVVQLLLAFIVLSVAQVVIYKFVPVPVTVTMLADTNGDRRAWVPIGRISRAMVDAAIAGEDGKFCSHLGFDTDAMRAAYQRNQDGGRIRGGSTISQQAAKNTFLWQGGGYVRKALEAWYTVLIEAIWGKRRIMEVYLNVAETGIGTYGVEAAAQRYFNQPAKNLGTLEAARIAAAFPQPKVRAVIGATGRVRRHGNVIAARESTVRGDYDVCVYK
ncbi:monofunctional biosynthetic peptidoglycan transglycosylase [Novosphingobium sp.]|uniref:monofunctional biosynthetic peptidoglycan transglycosylase n=1 Tax=Novosphingobium sp. TaxID=1874826 RepID=UPI003D132038